jgi:signal peptidase II
MKKGISLLSNMVIATIVFWIDRLTKQWAMVHAINGISINQFLSFDLVFNRGVTAGLLQSDSPIWFGLLSFIIAGIIGGLCVYTWYRWSQGNLILGEVLTIAGALSNVIDRYQFGGVIDFIHVNFHGYSFPIFNVADVCIVLGVAVMFLLHMKDDQ